MIRRTTGLFLGVTASILFGLAVWIGLPPSAEAYYMDLETGLQWRTAPGSWSYNSVLAQSGPGGTFEGFRHATIPEITALWESLRIIVGTDTAGNYQGVQQLMSIAGGNLGQGPVTKWFYGVTGTPHPTNPNEHLMVTISMVREVHCPLPSPTCSASAYIYGSQYDDWAWRGWTAWGNGHWLVMDPSVPTPEPASFLLLVSGLAGLAAKRRIRSM